MMQAAPSASQSTLPTEIQRALEDAVVEANNAFTQTTDAQKKKKKKRSRQHEEDADGTTDKERPKKKKKERAAVLEANDPPVDGPHATTGHEAPTEDPLPSEPKKKKKKKKNKGKKPESEPQAEVQAAQTLPEEIDSVPSQASTAAFLSAIVAAAAGTSDYPQNQPSQLPYIDNLNPPPPVDFTQYPQYPYSAQYPHMPPGTFPGAPNAFSELAYAGHNDDILRALQDLDVSKIAGVIKSFSEAAAAANHSGFLGHPLLEQTLTPLGQVPATSREILDAPDRRRTDMNLPGPENQTSRDHAHLLANKWLNPTKLAELVETEGLIYKKGKFSAIEEQQLKNAIETFRLQRDIPESAIWEIIQSHNKDDSFWSEITAAVPQRPIISVYHHVRRSYHPMKQQGKWTPEQDAELKQAVVECGQRWETVSKRVKRMASDCRDRWRNHIENKEVRVFGAWTPEEEEKLTRIVTEMTVQQGKNIDNDVFWGKVSECMGGKRSRQQCRIKWTDSLSKTFKNEGQKPRWSQQDAYILVHKVDSLNVRDDTEIDWKTLADSEWNLWSAHALQRRWLTMKRSVKGYEEMSHQEIMDILRVKKAQAPTAPAVSNRKRHKVTSAAAVVEEGNASGGSSTGLGTLADV